METIEQLRKEAENPLEGNWRRMNNDELQDDEIMSLINDVLEEKIVVWYDSGAEVRPIKMSLHGGGRISGRVQVPSLEDADAGLAVLLEISKGDNPLKD